MKLRKTLVVADRPYKLVEEDIRLDLHTAGRAVFRVQSTSSLAGLVRFFIGYSSQQQEYQFFTGYIESSHTVDSGTQRIFCRELAAALDSHLPLNLRHPTMREVLQEYTRKSGLTFVLPDRPYANRRVPHFQTLGNGYHGLDALGAVFGVAGYVWQQQADGTVFTGSWQDSRWATRPLTIPEEHMTAVSGTGSRRIAALPALRPGVALNGQYVTSLQLQGHEMVLKCAKQLNV